jgi:hypothetical protein
MQDNYNLAQNDNASLGTGRSPDDFGSTLQEEQNGMIPLAPEAESNFGNAGDLEDLIATLNLGGPGEWSPFDLELVEGVVDPQVRSRWLEVADQPVLPGAKRTVREVAFLVLDELKSNTTTFEATTRWLRMLSQADVLPGPSGPFESNKWPRSLYVCRSLLRVPDVSEYEVHVCPEGCRFYFEKLKHPDVHLAACSGCSNCRCPLCGAHRYQVTEGSVAVPASKCYFLYDVIELWMLDECWVEELQRAQNAAQTEQCSAWHRSKEFARIDAAVDEMTQQSTNDANTRVCVLLALKLWSCSSMLACF